MAIIVALSRKNKIIVTTIMLKKNAKTINTSLAHIPFWTRHHHFFKLWRKQREEAVNYKLLYPPADLDTELEINNSAITTNVLLFTGHFWPNQRSTKVMPSATSKIWTRSCSWCRLRLWCITSLIGTESQSKESSQKVQKYWKWANSSSCKITCLFTTIPLCYYR